MKQIYSLLVAAFLAFSFGVSAQQTNRASKSGLLSAPVVIPSIADQIKAGTLIYADDTPKLGRAKGIGSPNVVPGKGSVGNDPLVNAQRSQEVSMTQTRSPLTTFVADVSSFTPSDPTGAAGPNHYIAAWNVGFKIFNKDGTDATPEMDLSTLFPGNSTGDPIVFFDANVDNGAGIPRGRYVITEFRNGGAPGGNGFDVAISAGPDPVNDPWYIYEAQFNAGAFPDYTKFSVFGESYVVTANINSTTEQVFLLERNKMLNDEAAQFVAFGLPGIERNGFYSPQGFHTTGDESAPAGTPVPVVYLQDDAWGGVDDDHLKVWEATIDWADAANASIELAQEITTADFVSVFDGGSFSNIPQGGGGPDVDALQATMMNQVQYRRFPTYNTVVMNFVVDVLDPGEKAGIRWYELRQDGDGQPWSIYQEGTYVTPGKRNAYQGSMAMDSQGNIALGYISSSDEDRIAMNYTGRFDGDPLGVMTVYEQELFRSTAASPSDRFADYVHLTLDPENESFWFITEQFDPTRRDVVANFTLDAAQPDDLSVFSIVTPVGEGEYTGDEDIIVTIRNYGSNAITNPTVQYTVNGGAAVVETFTGTIEPGLSAEFTFAQGADLSEPGNYTLDVSTLLSNDSNVDNDSLVCVATNTVGLACQPDGDCEGFGDGVTTITLANQNALVTNCTSTGYSDDSGIEFAFDSPESLSGILQVGFTDSAFAIWIDINDDATFSEDELVSSGQVPTADTDFAFSIDVTSFDMAQLTAGPLTMRVRGEDESGAGDVNNPCEDLQYGRTNDYTATFTPEVLAVENNVFLETSLNITSTDNKYFAINVNTPFEGRAAISVFNTLGQRLAHNNLDKKGNGYTYDLDMSYVAAGVYIVQFTDIDGGSKLVEKIVVR
ncbi:GEVED domain-containing protein [Dokdonia sp. R86516]|uniref:GEVED domain-containing protein n=1 Tax=Dokdonia sp. R86516 TaxID=3093856 RepID=UPI0037C5D4A3